MVRSVKLEATASCRRRLTSLALCLLQTGCGKSESGGGGETAKKQTIQNKGSDTMVNLAQAWAEEYKKVAPDVDVEVSGGGRAWASRRWKRAPSTLPMPAAT